MTQQQPPVPRWVKLTNLYIVQAGANSFIATMGFRWFLQNATLTFWLYYPKVGMLMALAGLYWLIFGLGIIALPFVAAMKGWNWFYRVVIGTPVAAWTIWLFTDWAVGDEVGLGFWSYLILVVFNTAWLTVYVTASNWDSDAWFAEEKLKIDRETK